MNLYHNIYFILPVIFFIVGAIFIATGFVIYKKADWDDFWELVGIVVGFIGAVALIISFFALFINLYESTNQRNQEQVYFQSNVELRETLQKAIDNSEDIVNTDLYLRAVDFNTDLAKVQAAQNDPQFAMTFSGKVDWTTIPFINLD